MDIPELSCRTMGHNFCVALLASFVIKHRRTTPYWPEANAEMERFFRTLKKFLTTMEVEGKNWKDGIHKFLLTYRTTAHMSTGEAPCKLLMNRDLRTKLPENTTSKQSTILKEALKKKMRRKRPKRKLE